MSVRLSANLRIEKNYHPTKQKLEMDYDHIDSIKSELIHSLTKRILDSKLYSFETLDTGQYLRHQISVDISPRFELDVHIENNKMSYNIGGKLFSKEEIDEAVQHYYPEKFV